ncbi:MAG TPA: IS630 family transposase, partial [Xanthobacteraceae bacterium]|nr:IS630 family transposase [Xanthobacteraceae bacterium]
RRLACWYTPKHGSGLNIAENELRALTRQCLHDRRCGETKQRAEEPAAWSTSSNAKQRGVDWQFKINDARTKLKSLYPALLRCDL